MNGLAGSRVAIAALVVVAGGCSDEPRLQQHAAALSCGEAGPASLHACVVDYSQAVASCYESDGAPCPEDDSATARALDTLQAAVEGSCSDADAPLSVEHRVGRLRNACASEASALAWRVYGGPQGAVWPTVGAGEQQCLSDAHQAAIALVDASLDATDACLASAVCDAAAVDAARQELAAGARAAVESSCTELSELIAVDPATFVARAAAQVDCLAATGHDDTAPLALRCGPSYAQFEAARGTWTQVIVDGDEWGTLCGDGSPYAFQVRFAPEGEPLDRIVVGLQGGGVCLFEEDCAERMQSNPDLFMATDDAPIPYGIASDDPAESPFANWTKVYLPYCNQDVFAGGGVDEQLGAISVPRYGAVNMRAAIRMVRDVLWKMMDAEGGAGFRPDELMALFGGWSAGGYGTLYNYHWFLDDLQWPRTSAFPDAGLGLDNGSPLGVKGLGLVKIPAWGALPNLPPYCFGGDCAVGKVILERISPRLKLVPEQQMLLLTNPLDLTQQGDAFFNDTPSFINELRQSYCDTKDLNGVQYYLTSVSTESVHVVSLRPELWSGAVDSEVMRDWFWRAMTDADTITDRAEEADFATAVPGVLPFPCAVAP